MAFEDLMLGLGIGLVIAFIVYTAMKVNLKHRISVVEDKELGMKLYNDHWFGQFGSYKAEERGKLLKLDQFETVFL